MLLHKIHMWLSTSNITEKIQFENGIRSFLKMIAWFGCICNLIIVNVTLSICEVFPFQNVANLSRRFRVWPAKQWWWTTIGLQLLCRLSHIHFNSLYAEQTNTNMFWYETFNFFSGKWTLARCMQLFLQRNRVHTWCQPPLSRPSQSLYSLTCVPLKLLLLYRFFICTVL